MYRDKSVALSRYSADYPRERSKSQPLQPELNSCIGIADQGRAHASAIGPPNLNIRKCKRKKSPKKKLVLYQEIKVYRLLHDLVLARTDLRPTSLLFLSSEPVGLEDWIGIDCRFHEWVPFT